MDDNSQQFGPGFLPTFLYYFTSMVIITTLLAAQALHVSVGTGLPIQLGVIAGLGAGLLGAARNRTTSVTIPIQNRAAFLSQLEQVLADMGYQKADPTDPDVAANVIVYERSNVRRLFSGRVYAQVDKKQALIASRASITKRLQAALS